jgi:hypothetical protein
MFHELSLGTDVPGDHLLRSIDRFVDLTVLRQELAPFYASTPCKPVSSHEPLFTFEVCTAKSNSRSMRLTRAWYVI